MRDKKIGLIATGFFVCLLAGAGIEHVRHVLTTVPAEEPEPTDTVLHPVVQSPTTTRTVMVKDEAAEREAMALRQRVAELERALAERDTERAQEPATPPPEARAERPPRQSFSDRLEQMKKDDPAQYAETMKRRDEFRQSMEQRAKDRAEFIAAVDTKNMDDVQKENHTKLVETVAFVNELMAQMNQPGVEHTPEMHQQMGEAMTSLGDLYAAERSYLLEETGRAVGYQGSQATEFAAQVQAIIDNTTMPRGRGGRGGPPTAPLAAPAEPGK